MINMKPITDDEKYEIVNKIKNGASPVYDDAERQSLPLPFDCKYYKTRESHLEDTWIAYNNPCEEEELTYALIYVERLPYRLLCNTLNRKCFSSSMLNLIRRNELTPFLLFINGLFVPWQDIEILRDGNDNYLKINGKDYLYEYMKTINLYQLPYNVVYQGVESEGVFKYNYDAFVDYLDSHAVIKDNELYITLPDIDTTHKYKNKIYNIGYWMYTQIKEHLLGKLPNDRYDKLRQVTILKEVLNYKNELIRDYTNSVNIFDKDSYDNVLIEHLVNEYHNCAVLLNFDTEGNYIDPIRKPANANTICLKNSSYTDASDQEIMFKHITDQGNYMKIIGDHNMLGNLYKLNFLVFKNGRLAPDYIIDTYGPVIEIDARNSKAYDKYGQSIVQPSEGELEVVLFYDKRYFAEIGELKEITHYSNLPEECRKNVYDKIVYAIDTGTSSEKNFYKQWSVPLYCKFENNALLEDNVSKALSRIIDYDNRMLNPICKQDVYCRCFTGKEINDKLYTHSVSKKRGFDVPRMKYEDHEVYPLIFLNGELIPQYCELMVYTTHVFVPIENDYKEDDCIEIMYFLYINNNELSIDQFIPHYKLYRNVIPEEDIKVFSGDVKHLLYYKDLKYDPKMVAFKIDDRDENGKLSVDYRMTGRELTMVSSRKFVYERFYIDRKAYKIRLSNKFRYCDNIKQYVLFINGIKVPSDFYLITIPKVTRPFDYMYLYTAKFVVPTDRIELFYLPIELNFGIDMELSEDAIIQAKDQSDLYVPLDKECYIFFVNGRKIPKDYIMNIDSNRLGVKKYVPNKYSYNIQNITVLESYPVVETYVPEVRQYMINKHKSYIDNLNRDTMLRYGINDMLDNYNIHEKLADIDDQPMADVARIAILNEVIRDHWVTSGYDYNKEPFLYDYETDEYMVKDRNGNYTLPALDALPKINIDKTNLHTLYFKFMDYMPDYFEIGSTLNNITVQWEYNDNYNTQEIEKQVFCDNELDPNIRSITLNRVISSDTDIWLEATNGFNPCRSEINIRFCEGIYYGLIPEDRLDKRDSDDLSNVNNSATLFGLLKKSIQPTRQLDLSNYIIGNRLYFVVALPDSYIDSRLAFFLPDPKSDKVLNNIDDKTLPVFTNGKYDKEDNTGYHGNLIELDKYEMEVLYKCNYTNKYGHSANYTVYKANGYFTRLFENVKFDIAIR